MSQGMILEKPVNVYLQATNTCGLACRQCYTNCSKTPPADELSLREWRDFLDYLEANGVLQVNFEGGDCLDRPDFLDIVRHATTRFLVYFRTHATHISEELAADIAELGVGRVVVDLFAGTQDRYEMLSGVPGTFESAVTGARRLRAAGVKVIPVCILNRHTVAGLQDFIDLVATLDVEETGLLRLYPIGRARDNWDMLAPSLDEITAALARLKVPAGLRVMQGFHPNDSNCCWVNAGITSTGRSIGCPYLREYVDYGNIRDVPFLETWNHPLYQHLRHASIDDACPECTGNQSLRPGGCRSTAYAFHGDWDAPDPFCTSMNRGVDVKILPPRRGGATAEWQGTSERHSPLSST